MEHNFDSNTFFEKSTAAFGLALDTVNRLGIKYRLDAFCILYCNAFDLLLKAKQVRDLGPDSIISNRQPGKTHSLSRMLQLVFLDTRDPVRRNCEVINELRDKATHLRMPDLAPEFASIIQAAILNYQTLVKEWFQHDLTSEIPIGMMTIRHDYDDRNWDYQDEEVRTRLGSEMTRLLVGLRSSIKGETYDMANPYHFAIPLEFKLLWTDAATAGVTVITSSNSNLTAGTVAIPVDYGKTHPYRQKDALDEIKRELGIDDKGVNQYDLQAVNAVHSIQSKPKMHYRSPVEGSPGTYSQAYVDWIVESVKNDPSFFADAREKYKTMKQSGATDQ